MFLPDLNMRRTASWHKEGDPEDLSADDSQVCGYVCASIGCVCLFVCVFLLRCTRV